MMKEVTLNMWWGNLEKPGKDSGKVRCLWEMVRTQLVC